MDKKLPLYEMMIGDTIEGEEEVDFIALVEYPAIQRNFLAFKDHLKDDLVPVNFNQFSIENPEQKIVTGALMIADLPIYRRDGDEEYYVTFSAAEIKKIVQRFFKKGYQSKVNVEHSTPVDGVYMFESFIIDREKGIMPPKGFEDISNGSWFGSFKVDNEKIWNEVKEGTFKGFSVEGLFRYEKTNKVITQEEEIMSQIFKILRQIEH
jgi:rhamnogalacturonyl hydrolase YesR